MNAQKRETTKAAVRREQLLDVAQRLFCEHGYAGTSTRRVAEAAGVTEGLLFHYFGSKEDLLLLVASRQHSFAGRVLALMTELGDGTAKELFLRIGRALVDVGAAEAALVSFLMAESQINPVLRERVAEANRLVLAEFARLLEVRVGVGELAPADFLVAAIGFFGAFQFFFAQHRHLSGAAFRNAAESFGEQWAMQCWRALARIQN